MKSTIWLMIVVDKCIDNNTAKLISVFKYGQISEEMNFSGLWNSRKTDNSVINLSIQKIIIRNIFKFKVQ